MSKITKQQAALLVGYNYQIYNAKRGKFKLIGMLDNSFVVEMDKPNTYRETIPFDSIGTDYKIIAIPLEDLTEEIKGIGVPYKILEEKEPDYIFDIDHEGNLFIKDRCDLNVMIVDRFDEMISLIKEWHFDLFPEGTTINPKDI